MEKGFVDYIFNLFGFLVSARLLPYFFTLYSALQELLVLMLEGHRVSPRRRVAVQQLSLQQNSIP